MLYNEWPSLDEKHLSVKNQLHVLEDNTADICLH